MKRKTYLNAFAALLLAFGFASCTSEEFYDTQDEGGVVSMTVGIRKAGVFDGDTRTSLSETETGDLKCVWESDDRIMVSDANGDIKGYLSLKDGDGTNFAHFHSDNLERITADTQNLNFVYLGREKKQSDLDNSAQYKYISLFYNNQTGTMESLSDKDILVKTGVSVSVSDGKVYTADGNDVVMTRPFAFGHFTLSFPDGVSRTNETVTITAPEGGVDGIRCAVNLHYNGQIGIGNNSKGISVNGQTGNDLYITIPMQDNSTVTPTFSVTINGKEYSGSLAERRWTANEYVRKDLGEGNTPRYSGQPVDMTIKKDDETTGPETVGPAIEYDGKKWRFVVGNLYYNTNTGVWGIHPNQAYFTDAGGIDYAGATILTSPELIGHFAWGATGIENAQKPTTIKMNQWDKTCGGSYWPSAGSNNSSIKDLWLNDGVFDFGEAYMRSGRLADDKRTYRTPRKEMFEALFNNYFIQGCIIKKAGIDGSDVHGLIVLCGISKNDKEGAKNLIKEKGGSYNTSYMNTLVNHNNQGSTFDYNAITLESIDMLKNLDAIFFPAANGSNLNGGTIYKTDGRGYYWFAATSSTTNATNLYFAGGYDKAYGFFYNGNSGSSSSRNQQKAVRLVVEVTE